MKQEVGQVQFFMKVCRLLYFIKHKNEMHVPAAL